MCVEGTEIVGTVGTEQVEALAGPEGLQDVADLIELTGFTEHTELRVLIEITDAEGVLEQAELPDRTEWDTRLDRIDEPPTVLGTLRTDVTSL
jgi:hypothetical protein